MSPGRGCGARDGTAARDVEKAARADSVPRRQRGPGRAGARHLARQGQALADLLWVPGGAFGVEETDAPVTDVAAGAADAWLGMLGE
jgi:hypothetical protein